MKNLLLMTITVYEKFLSPLLHQLLGIKTACRQYPTCKAYAREAIMQYGACKGLLLSVKRIINCQPLFSV